MQLENIFLVCGLNFNPHNRDIYREKFLLLVKFNLCFFPFYGHAFTILFKNFLPNHRSKIYSMFSSKIIILLSFKLCDPFFDLILHKV